MEIQDIFELGDWDAEQIADPDWEEFEQQLIRVHEWRGYIPREVRGDIWQQLSSDAKVLAYIMAKHQADNEEWD